MKRFIITQAGSGSYITGFSYGLFYYSQYQSWHKPLIINRLTYIKYKLDDFLKRHDSWKLTPYNEVVY